MMKRMLTLFAFLFLIYIIYYDLKIGTLPFTQPVFLSQQTPNNKVVNHQQYVVIKVKEGDTVLSVVENLHHHTLPVSIETIIHDFEQLNPNISVHQLKIGNSYKFPVYK
jgi:hypothetical protein